MSKAAHHPIHEANKRCPFGGLTREEFYKRHRVIHHQSFMPGHQKRRIFTQTWQPAAGPSAPHRGIVAMVHGYASESSWVFQLTAVAIARLGFYVCALDIRGHGYSDGRRGSVPVVDAVVEDCLQFFDSVRSGREKLPAFLYGESLGGAVAILVYLRQKGQWSGLVLNGPMCGISKRYKPPWPLENFLPLVALFAPNWKIWLTKSLAKQSYKEKWKQELVASSPNKPRGGKAPAATALEFLRIVKIVQRSCGELDLPMLVLHGRDDRVCDVESTERVYEMAASREKKLHVFGGMGHQLVGETAGAVDLVFGVIFSWLLERTGEGPLEGDGKPGVAPDHRRFVEG